MQGPILTATASSKKQTASATGSATTTTSSKIKEEPLKLSTAPLSPSLSEIQSSLPSFSQRMRSPSILGTPALDTPLVPAAAAPTERLIVTKLGGCTLVNQYLVVQYLGRGTSGKVYLCIDVFDKRLYAVKIVRKTHREEKREEEDEKSQSGKTTTSSVADGKGSKASKNDGATTAAAVEQGEEVDQPPPKTSNEEEEKFAAKARRMKEKAALRNQNNSTTNSTTTNNSKTKRGGVVKSKSTLRDPLIDLRREVEILRSVGSNHPNVVALREIVDDPTSNKMLIVMEYCEGGPVMTRAGLERGRRIPEAVARPYFRDMIAALGHLHKNRVIHGDLKPENALMSANGRIALSDFGCSKILPESSNPKNDLIDRCNGTPAFLAPEMMTPGATFRGRPADVYSLGTCLYTFIFGCIPFTADSVSELFKIVKTQELTFPDVPSDASDEVKALLRGLLAKDPEKRMTLEKAARHRWTTDAGRLPPVSMNNNTSNSTTDISLDPHLVDGDTSLAGLLTSAGVETSSFLPGQVIVRQGDRSTNLMYILQGNVDVLYRPSEEVMKGVQQQLSTKNKYTNSGGGGGGSSTEKKQDGGKTPKSGGGGLGVAITKLWSPSSRSKRENTSTNNTTPTATVKGIPSLDLNRATTSNFSSLPPLPPAMLSARSTSATTPRTTGPLSSRLGNTPEPSPRIPIHGTAMSTGALSTSFQLHQGIGTLAGGGGGYGGSAYSIDSAVTTPAITPLPSARGSDGGGAPHSSRGGGGEKEKEREPTPYFTPLPSSINTGNLHNTSDCPPSEDHAGQTFSTPAAAEGAATSTLPTVETPGSGNSSKLAAYPLHLTPKEMSGSGDLDIDEENNTTTTSNTIESSSNTAATPPTTASASATTPIPTIREEEEHGAVYLGDRITTQQAQIETEKEVTFEPPPPFPERESGLDGDAYDAINEATTIDNDDNRHVLTSLELASSPESIPCALAVAAEEAGDFIQSLYREGKNSNGGGEYLLALRSAGDFIGETALIGGSSVRRSCSIRASTMSTNSNTTQLPTSPPPPPPNENTSVTVVTNSGGDATSGDTIANNTVQVAVIPYSVAKEYLKTHPLAKQRLAEMVWSRQSETIVLEGLLRLAGISKELNEEARRQVEKSIDCV